MSDTRLPNLGTALAIIYATMTTPPVHESQVTQCVTVLAVRCLDPRRMRMKTYLAGIFKTRKSASRHQNHPPKPSKKLT